MKPPGRTKEKLASGQVALGAWNMIPHPAVAEILAGENFDWVAADLEHAAHTAATIEQVARVAHAAGKDCLARLPACDPVAAKVALDAGADGIIVPSVNTPDLARQAVAMAKYPPEGIRGTSLARCTDYGRRFAEYVGAHNARVVVVVMLEHEEAVRHADAILAVPGLDAALIGPYDLSASMGRSGQIDHPEVLAAQAALREACLRRGVAPGIHVVPLDPPQVTRRLAQGFRFLALGLDTGFLIEGCRAMLAAARPPSS